MDGILYITPSPQVSDEPVIDEVTRKMTAALNAAVPGTLMYGMFKPDSTFRGVHMCACGAQSSNQDYQLPAKLATNSLAIHYLAFHRTEIADETLALVANFHYGEQIPTTQQLARPQSGRGVVSRSSTNPPH